MNNSNYNKKRELKVDGDNIIFNIVQDVEPLIKWNADRAGEVDHKSDFQHLGRFPAVILYQVCDRLDPEMGRARYFQELNRIGGFSERVNQVLLSSEFTKFRTNQGKYS